MLSYNELYKKVNKEARKEMRFKIIQTYLKNNNISKTSKECGCSRLTVRKWLKRYKDKGLEGLEELSRRPKNSPNRTDLNLQQKIMKIREQTGYGRKRIAIKLGINEWTVRNVFRQNGIKRKNKKRKTFYPAY